MVSEKEDGMDSVAKSRMAKAYWMQLKGPYTYFRPVHFKTVCEIYDFTKLTPVIQSRTCTRNPVFKEPSLGLVLNEVCQV